MIFLWENLFTILIATLVAVLIGLAALKLVRDRKKRACTGGCAGCPYAGHCHDK